ncbi:MAG: DUF4282 domain-containing protein [Tetrasphaera sp.]
MSTQPPSGPHADPPPYPEPPTTQPGPISPPAGYGASGAPPPSTAAAPPSGAGPRAGSIGSPAGFFAALFDFSFSRFITPMIIRFVYVLATALIGLIWFVLLIRGFANGAAEGLVVLLLGPVFAIIYLAFIRMTLEIYLAVVRMSEDIHQRLPHS